MDQLGSYLLGTPNFFIVGAPKCGTTSLASWLQAHENVFIPKLKEPEYYNTDHKRRRRVSPGQYERMFAEASPDKHIAIGEASVWYLYSDVAVKRIIEVYGDQVKFVVMLRNPLEMAVSLHQHKLYMNFEHISEFEAAWRAQDERRATRYVKSDAEASQLVYGETCKLGNQLARLLSTVERGNVLPILLQDINDDAGAAYRKVLSFLKVPDDGRQDFPRLNQAKTYKSKVFHNAVQGAAKLKHMLGIHHNFNLLRLNQKPARKPMLSPGLIDEMKDYFREDVSVLSAILERDLSDWVT